MPKNVINNDAPVVPKCFYRVSIKALILDEQKKFALSFEKKGSWDMPGGGLDFGESITEALKREIKEETGLEVTCISERPSYILTAQNARQTFWVCNLIYEVKVKDLNFTPSAECLQLKFFTKEEALKEKLYRNVTEFIKMYKPEKHK